MKKLKLITTLFIAYLSVNAQCYNNLNTRTTDPTELYAADGKNPNTVYLDAAHTIPNPKHFNWINPTITHNWYWSQNTAIPAGQILLPYYCNGSLPTFADGSCQNENTYYYKNLIDNFATGISVHDKNKAFDILPEDGWELMYKYFGEVSTPLNNDAKIPSFVLYNRYTSKLKVFAAATGLPASFIGISNVNRAALRLSFAQTQRTALFGMAQPITQVLSAYTVSPTQANDSHFMNNEFDTPNADLQLNPSSGNIQPQYQWLMSEFTVPYDPCTCVSAASPNNIPQIQVSIVLFSDQTIDMAGIITGKLTATPSDFFSGDHLNINNKGDAVATKGNVQNGLEGALKGYESWSGYAEKVKGIFEDKSGGNTSGLSTTNIQINSVVNSWFSSTNQSGTYTQQQKNTSFYNIVLGGTAGKPDEGISKFAGFKSILSNIATIAPYVGAFVGLIDAFSGGGQENAVDNITHVTIDNPPPPSNYDVDLKVKLSGKISTQLEAVKFNIDVPGSRSTYNITGPAPIYNNILGVFNILNQPKFERTPLQITNSFSSYTNYNFPYSSQCLAHPVTFDADFNNINLPVWQYKISQNVKYILNPAAMLDIESIDASIVLEYDNATSLNITNATQLNNQQQIPFHTQIAQTGVNLENRINYMKQSGLELEYVSDDYPLGNSSILRFRTPYVPLESLGNINFLLYGSPGLNFTPKTYLKLYCRFKNQNSTNSDPVVIIQTFDISNAITNSTLKPQINNAGTINITAPPVFTTFCPYVYGNTCLIWVDGSGNHPCDQSYDVNYPPPTINSLNLNSLAYPNIYIQPSSIFNGGGTFATASNITFNTFTGPQSLITYPTNPALFITLENIYFENNSINPAPAININLPYDNFIASKGIYFDINSENITFQNSYFIAGKEIVIDNPKGVGVTFLDETVLAIEPNTTNVYNGVWGNYGQNIISNLANDNTDINPVCASGALRLMANAANPKTAGANGVNPIKQTPNFKTLEQNDYKIGIYPNPTTGNLNVNFFTATAKNVILSIEDVTGKLLLQQNISVEQGYSNNVLDLQSYLNGIYILKITNAQGGIIKTEKVVVNR